MKWKSFAAAAAVCALMAATANVYAQETSTSSSTVTTTQTEIFTTIPEPERGYGTTIYTRIPETNRSNFVTWFQGFTPDQQRLILRTLYRYSMGGPDVVAFTTDTTPDVAMPVFVKVLEPTDQPTFQTFWGTMTPVQQTTFISTAGYLYPTTTTTMMPDTTVTTTDTTTTTGGMAQPMFGTVAFVAYLPETARATFAALAPMVPAAELGGMEFFLRQFSPDQAAVLVQAFSAIQQRGTSSTPQTGVTDNDARELLRSSLQGGDQSAFDALWTSMTPDQRFIAMQLARDAYNGGFNDMGSSATMGSSSGG